MLFSLMLSSLTLLALALPVASTTTTSSDCDAFSSNGIAAANYQYYRFYDFRHISKQSSSRKHRRSLDGRSSSAQPRNKTVDDASWTDDWYIRDYPRASPGGTSIPVDFIKDRVSISTSNDSSTPYSTYLTLSTSRISSTTQEAGEITFFNASHASLRVLARAHGSPGAVAGIFTYLNDTQESDIELFTRAPTNRIQYSNQPSSSGSPNWTPIPGATVNDTLPDGATYDDWHVHRLDWTPGMSAFFVDDTVVNSTTEQVPVGDPSSGLYIDMWSANSSWTGSMDIGGEANLDVLWVEILYNVTSDKAPAQVNGGKVCQVQVLGKNDMGNGTKTSNAVILGESSGANMMLAGLFLLGAGLVF